MKIHLRFFAVAKELLGRADDVLELPMGSRVSELRERLGEVYPSLLPVLARTRIAVNSEFASETAILTEDCEAALIPPVSGG